MPGQPQPRRGAGPRQQRGQPQPQGGRGGPQGRGMPQQPQVSARTDFAGVVRVWHFHPTVDERRAIVLLDDKQRVV